MPMETEEISRLWGIVAGILVLALLLLWAMCRLRPFLEKLRYTNMEIRRTESREREYWCAQRRHLWIALFNPFVRM